MQSPRLPFEILEVIAFKNPMTFKLMYATCRRMTQMDVLKMMDESTVKTKTKHGVINYMLPNGQKHRVYDLPAVIYSDGHQLWYRRGQTHRDNGPSIIYADSQQEWYKNGHLHRKDGPAVIYANGNQLWYKNGKRHRDGSLEWYKNGQRHRDDGPAIIYSNEAEEWYKNDEKTQKKMNIFFL